MEIRLRDNAKYLGVILDRKLSFKLNTISYDQQSHSSHLFGQKGHWWSMGSISENCLLDIYSCCPPDIGLWYCRLMADSEKIQLHKFVDKRPKNDNGALCTTPTYSLAEYLCDHWQNISVITWHCSIDRHTSRPGISHDYCSSCGDEEEDESFE